MRWARWWAGAALLLAVVTLAVYGVGQQVGRRSADDVPAALGADSVQRLGAGAEPQSLVGATGRELTSAAQPFVVVYDSGHHVLASDVTVHGQAPVVPSGVLDSAAQGVRTVTWQPAPGVREAVYASAWQHGAQRGVVVTGMGLGPTEDRAALLQMVLMFGWLVVVAGLGVLFLTAARLRDAGPRRRPPPPPRR